MVLIKFIDDHVSTCINSAHLRRSHDYEIPSFLVYNVLVSVLVTTVLSILSLFFFKVLANRKVDNFDGYGIDRITIICSKLVKKFETIPTYAKELVPLINEPLLGKLPAIRSERFKYPILSNVIYSNKEDCQSEIAIYMSYILTEQFGYEVSDVKPEDMMHQIIDNLINTTFFLFSRHNNEGALQIEISRNTRDYGYPDFLLYNKNTLVLKRRKNFAQISAGWKIGFYTIDGTPEAASMPSRLVHLAGVFDLRNPCHWIKVISSIINIIHVLLTISPILPTDIIPLGRPLRLQPNLIIIFDYTSVTKEVSIKNLPYADDINARVKFLSSMENVSIDNDKRTTPEDEQQLKIMTKNVLAGLECLHEGGFVHRDIRKSNILYVISDNPANSCYVLIDWGKPGDKLTEWFKIGMMVY
ncbi:23136_t:CDS:2 [Gigaspora margarita]|uniref:23136_t:CDS:1 n=1 Tax=Gigaspora margarita TaxID=4874 RepID=A0ABN7UR82_GIGMA|nr:23136_t:CDS:2 [Gigaspora margarita]